MWPTYIVGLLVGRSVDIIYRLPWLLRGCRCMSIAELGRHLLAIRIGCYLYRAAGVLRLTSLTVVRLRSDLVMSARCLI